MSADPKMEFFDDLADRWDGFEDLDLLARKLDRGLVSLGLSPDEQVVDVGCGTGNLTQALLRALSSRGRVLAVDVSAKMLARAQEKIDDARVAWHLGDAQTLPVDDSSIDRVICFSVWPHFDRPEQAAAEFWRVLRPSGRLHVWHLASRAKINGIHAAAHPAVAGDLLAPVSDTARVLSAQGFSPFVAEEDEDHYLVSAEKRVDR
jgi:ubiquinone/menaquinone biosynthesis C-methylase UbiE